MAVGERSSQAHGAKATKASLNELGEKIFLDRYALKDMTKRSLVEGDTVIVCVDQKTRQREIGTVKQINKGRVTIELRDGTVTEQGIEDVDKPLETTPDQMMARVARGIAAIETNGEQREEWETNFRWLLDDWRFVPGGRILTAAGTEQQLTFFNCMPPEQEILTEHGYKPIAEVGIGERVVTHRNRLRTVLNKFEREAEEPLYVIKPKKLGYDDLRVTGEHKILAIRSEWINKHRSRDGLRVSEEAQWIPAKDLRAGDFLAAAYNGEERPVEPIYVSSYIDGYEQREGSLYKPQQRSTYRGQLTAGGTHHDITDRLVIDADLCYLFGRWLGDGNINHRAQSDIPSGIKIVFGLHEREDAEHIAAIIERKFGVTTHLKVSSTERWLDLWANSMALGQFFKAFLGCYSYGKQIPEQLMHLPYELTLALLKGLFKADGYTSDCQVGIVLSNRTLATQVHQSLMRLGYFFSIRENTHRLGRYPAYRVQATGEECAALFKDLFGREAPAQTSSFKSYLEHDDLRWVRIEEIAIEDYQGVVLDIEVEEDHSFVSAGVVVSNCYVIPSPQDSRRGIVDTLSQMMEIMSRGGGVGINLSSLRPRHAYVKGVNGRSSGSVSWGGLYSFVTGLIEQGGCLIPDTLVATERGLLRLDEIVTHQEQGWREQTMMIMTDEGDRLSRQVFNNGVADVLEVSTDMGLSITGTPNHKVKVMTASGPAWRQLDALQEGDTLIVKLGQHRGTPQTLRHPEYTHHNQDHVELPQVLDQELAFFLGYLAGDGFMTTRTGDWRLGVAVAHDSYLIDEMPALMQHLFKGANVRIQQKADDASLIYLISNRAVKEFLTLNGFDKATSTNVQVPRLIRQSPPEIVGAFLRGLFEADGAVSHGYPALTSTSKRLIDEVGALLMGLGCPVKIERQPISNVRLGTKQVWRLRIHSYVGLNQWRAVIGCDAGSRFEVCQVFEPDMSREVSYVLPHASYWVEPVLAATAVPQIDPRATGQRGKGSDPLLRRKLQRYARGDRSLTKSGYTTLSAMHPEFAAFAPPVDDTWYITVNGVRAAGQAQTLDLEVDDNHTYIANGIVTHNSRRGALMLILNVWHPDVMNFINAKREMGKITNANISVGLTDAFMEAVQADGDWDLVFPDSESPGYDQEWDGDIEKWRAAGKPVNVYKTVKAREIWNSIVESAWSSAEPGLWFIDRANKMSNSHYFSQLICTNPCVTGDTLVSTEHGYTRARDLQVGMNIRTPAGLKPIEKIYNNGVQRIHRIEFSDGGHLECTADHKLKVVRNKKYAWIATNELQEGDKVLVSSNEAFGPRHTLPPDALAYIQKRRLNVADYYDRRIGFLTGVVTGDGVLRKVPVRGSHSYQCHVAFGSNEETWEKYFTSLMDEMNIHTHRTLAEKEFESGDGTLVVHASIRLQCYKLATLLAKIGFKTNVKAPLKTIPEPFLDMEKEFLAGVLDGLFSTDGSVLMKQDNPMLRFHTSSYELAQQVRLILLQFGIHGRIYRSERDEALEYDGRSMLGTGEKFDVVIMNEGIARFYSEIGLSHPEKSARLKDVAENWHYIGGTWTASVVSIQDTERDEEVFDVYEPNTLTWITNGYVSFDCGEQPLPAWGICNLGALNLSQFVEDGDVNWDDLRLATRYAVRFLDNVIDATPYFFDENQQQQQNERRVGLGIMGLADMLIKLGIRYGSEECIAFLDKLGEAIATEAYHASADNAQEKGAFPMFDAEKLLQSGYMEAMPEHVREAVREKGLRNVTLLTVAPTGTTGTMVGTSTGVEPYFSWSYFRKSRLGVHEEKVAVVGEWEAANPGQPLPDYFVNAMSLSPIEHVNVQAAVQRWIDSAISKTCNVPSDYTIEQTRELYEYMYRLGCKGGTIYRDGSRDEQVLNLKKDEDKPAAAAAPEAVKPATESSKQIAALWNQPKIRPRPKLARGATIKKESPLGALYVTINNDDEGEPLEVFVTAGKAGSDVTSMADALGRLASLVLRVASPVTPHERMEEIIAQLKGIGGARSMGFGPNRVRSLPDAVAQALEECCLPTTATASTETDGNGPVQVQLALPSIRADLCPQCGEAAFVHEEGCMHCNACGFSQC